MISMKRIIAMFIASALILLATAPVSSASAESPAVVVTSVKVEPEALMPGDSGTISICIKNTDTHSSKTETTVETLPYSQKTTTSTGSISAEISNIRLSSGRTGIEWLREGSLRSEYYNIGALGQGESMTVVIPIKAATHIRDGTYHPEVCIEVKNGKDVRFPVPVRVDSGRVELIEEDVPAEISLHESKEIVMVVANNRPNSVNGVLVTAVGEDMEIMPERIFMGNLAPYEKRKVNFSVSPLSPGNKDIHIEVKYRNGCNSHRSTHESRVFVRNSTGMELILVYAPRSVLRGEVAKIEFDVANGLSKDVRAVSVVPRKSRDRGAVILPSEYFIGDMEAGDVFSASFSVDTSELEEGDNIFPFDLAFRDVDTDRTYEIGGYELHIEVKEPQENRWLQSAKPILLAAGTLMLALIVGVMWLRARHRRKKRTA